MDEQQPLELPKATDLFKRAWVIFRTKVRTFLLIQIVPFIVAVPLGLVAEYFDKKTGDVVFSTVTTLNPEQWIAILVMIFAVVAGLVIQTWAQIATIIAIRDRNVSITVKEAFSQAIGFIFSYWWIYFLVGLAVLGGFILLIVPGIIFAIRYSLSGYALVVEGKKGREALQVSRSYVKGHIGEVLWRLAFVGLVYILVFGLPSAIFEGLKMEALGASYTLIAAVILTPVAAIYSFLIYESLKKIKSNVV